MTRLLITIALLAAGASAMAQTDVRALYNFAEDSPAATAILESWGTDNWGDTFSTAEFGFKADPFSLNSGAFEITRSFNFWSGIPVLKDFSLQAGFEGRLNMDTSSALVGLAWTAPVDKHVLRAAVLYRGFTGNVQSYAPVQLNLMWRMYDLFGAEGLDFRGLLKAWGENTSYWYGESDPVNGETGFFILRANPQLWYAFGRKFGADGLSLGGEVELSYNWLGCRGFKARPSVGLKLQF